jgi:hypothetical protein
MSAFQAFSPAARILPEFCTHLLSPMRDACPAQLVTLIALPIIAPRTCRKYEVMTSKTAIMLHQNLFDYIM